MSLGARLRKSRTDAKLTQAQVAESCRKTLQTVSGWERGLYEPSADDLTTIAQLTNVNIEWLISGHAPTALTMGSAWRGRIVPSFDWGQIGEHLEGTALPQTHARSHHPCGPKSFQTFIADRSNEPELQVGDGIVIDPDLAPMPGDLVVIRSENEFLVRRFRPRADHIELAPSNPDWPALIVPRLGEGALVGVISEISKPRRR